MSNLGENYESLPTIKGVAPAPGFRAEVKAVRDASTNSITSVDIDFAGQQYSKPQAVVAGDGTGLQLEVQEDGGLITAVMIVIQRIM